MLLLLIAAAAAVIWGKCFKKPTHFRATIFNKEEADRMINILTFLWQPPKIHTKYENDPVRRVCG